MSELIAQTDESKLVRIYGFEMGVELWGFEPQTSCMPCKRSTN
jgi:hypothetical protein